jgi:hypothetical protein
MKLAHLILAHSNPQQVERLVGRLQNEKAHIYIQLDKKSDIAAYQSISLLQGVFFIKNRVDIGWGNYSMIQATLNGFEEILAAGIVYTHINLLSGQDYPLKSAAHVQDFLFLNPDKSYMCWLDIEKDWPDGRARLADYNFGDYTFSGKYSLQKVVNKLWSKKKRPDNLKPYGRSQWLTITPESAIYAIKYIKENPKLRRYFKHTWAVDEIFFQTILLNSPLSSTLVNNNLRYIEQDEFYRPTILTMADAEVLIDSGKFYARKFDPGKDTAIFDYLDKAADSEV